MHAILALCFLGLVAAQAPVPCTTPQQWEANIFDINESHGFMVRGRLSYDAVYHRERLIEVVDIDRSENTYEIIALFDLNIEYIYDFKARNCSHSTIHRRWRDFGISPDARSLGETYVGTSAIPGAGILTSLWGNNFTTPTNDSVRTFGVWTYQHCLPVRLISHSTTFGRTQTSFFDIVDGISDPNVFIPRQECLTAEEYENREALFGTPPMKARN